MYHTVNVALTKYHTVHVEVAINQISHSICRGNLNQISHSTCRVE